MESDSDQLVVARPRGAVAALPGDTRRGCCARIAAPALLHINILLMLYSGAGLSLAARLRWDASTYLAARLLLPVEARVLAAVLPVGAAVLLALAHLALVAHHLRPRCAALLYYAYAAGMALLVVGEVCTTAWVALRVRAWLSGEEARTLLEALRLVHSVRALIDRLGHVTVIDDIRDVIHDVEADAPQNLYVVVGSGVALLVLQVAAVALALAAARAAQHITSCPRPARSTLPALRVRYKAGRMQVVN